FFLGWWRCAVRLPQKGRRKHLSADRPGVPLFAQGFDTLWLGPGKIPQLHAIGLQVVKFPRPSLVGDELPFAVAHGAVAFVFPESRAALDRSIGERRKQALALRGLQLVALVLTGVFGSGSLQTGRHQVDEVADLLPQFATRLDASRPVDDERRTHAALVAVVF